MIYIIADDLTGANDTGVQFSKQGYKTQVMIVSEKDSRSLADSGSLAEDIDVFVIDTETRDVDAVTARNRIRSVLKGVNIGDEDLVYKKVDSTLRGNIGAELDECMRIFNKNLCIFTPSFPPNKRITVEGYLIVQDQPLGLSEYYSGDLVPEEASFIPFLLKQHTGFPIARIDLKEVIKGRDAISGILRKLYRAGKKIIVVDAINEEQLRAILLSSFDFQGTVLYCGSAGLANAFTEMYHERRHAPMPINKSQKSVLIVSGSRRTIAQRQIEYLKSKIDLVDVRVHVEQIFADRQKYLDQCVTKVTQAIQDERHVVIHPDPRYHDKHIYQKLLLKYTLDLRELELTIRRFLGEVVANIMENTPVHNIILTGGDTAIGVCSVLQIYNLNIVDELLPGIPLSVGQFKDKIDLNIVTKAGGFGEEDTFYTLVQKLTHYHYTLV